MGVLGTHLIVGITITHCMGAPLKEFLKFCIVRLYSEYDKVINLPGAQDWSQ